VRRRPDARARRPLRTIDDRSTPSREPAVNVFFVCAGNTAVALCWPSASSSGRAAPRHASHSVGSAPGRKRIRRCWRRCGDRIGASDTSSIREDVWRADVVDVTCDDA
jgi:hypothetical protein